MKKKLLGILTAVMLIAIAILPGCYVIQAQKMKDVKGTYALSHYSITDGETNKTTDYVEQYGYEEYLVVTGTSQGYLVHKDNNQAAYSIPVTLSYEYDEEDSSRVAYVKFNTSTSSSDQQKFGVTKDSLSYSRPGINIGIAHTDTINKSYKKVDNAIDLSYAKSKFSSVTEYTLEGFNNKGIWMMYGSKYDAPTDSYKDVPYVYYFVAINGYDNQVTVYWADKNPEGVTTTPQQKQKTLTLPEGFTWSALEIDGRTWTKQWGTSSYSYTPTSTEAENYPTSTWSLSRRYATVNLTLMQEEIDTLLGLYTNAGNPEE